MTYKKFTVRLWPNVRLIFPAPQGARYAYTWRTGWLYLPRPLPEIKAATPQRTHFS